ncbi:acetoin utilization deacetylase AcuC-like enzyme [Natronocella acetinitrilica]|uniref:Acetoin utilization deacetylase AcuC-like enzyme n=1 Tax=Natronocella acetinitrilica TaxID=414046 RepID=A0AAE3KBZ2_9GAMM|nr:histone deacetylase family protein [Natronocella acetinitrilica]MCP1675156.1 acetoin utilization deacetylase AcuC-like enzyme [Natronocella acetinitrilica]
MTTLLFTHESCLQHDTGRGHPESPDRLRVVLDRLRQSEFHALEWREAPRATLEQIRRMHDATYVDAVLARIPKQGLTPLDGDTVVSPQSGEAALRAAGATCAAVDAVMKGEARRAFCAVRPPGHHAEPDQAMGFCLFNNVAIGAAHAMAQYHLDRVAIIDFDVHHGNGTEAMLRGRRGYLYASSHEHPLYPGTGSGPLPGVDNIINVPLGRMTDSLEFRDRFREDLLPAVRAFGPQLIFISAGFDAHANDPLANLNLEAEDFAWATTELLDIADRFANGNVISTLEGGYDLPALAESTAAHVRALMDA